MIFRATPEQRLGFGQWHFKLYAITLSKWRGGSNQLPAPRILTKQYHTLALKLGLLDDEPLDGPIGQPKAKHTPAIFFLMHVHVVLVARSL